MHLWHENRKQELTIGGTSDPLSKKKYHYPLLLDRIAQMADRRFTIVVGGLMEVGAQ